MFSPFTLQEGPNSSVFLPLIPFLTSFFCWTALLCLSFHRCYVPRELVLPGLYSPGMCLSSPTDLTTSCTLMTPKSLPCWPFLQSSKIPIQLPHINGFLPLMFHRSLKHNVTKTKTILPKTGSSFWHTWKYYHPTQRKKPGAIISIFLSPNTDISG